MKAFFKFLSKCFHFKQNSEILLFIREMTTYKEQKRTGMSICFTTVLSYATFYYQENNFKGPQQEQILPGQGHWRK